MNSLKSEELTRLPVVTELSQGRSQVQDLAKE